MYFREITKQDENMAKLNLEAAIFNNEKEIEIMTFIADELQGYTGQFNKRLATFLTDKLAVKFGTYEYQAEWGDRPITVHNNVTVSFSKYPYGEDGKYQLGFGYMGKNVNRDYATDDRTYKLMNHFEYERPSEAKDVAETIEKLNSQIEYKRNTIVKFKENKRQLSSLVKQHNKLSEAISKFNDLISYPISDSLRIRG